jgi:hypothetical protein
MAYRAVCKQSHGRTIQSKANRTSPPFESKIRLKLAWFIIRVITLESSQLNGFQVVVFNCGRQSLVENPFANRRNCRRGAADTKAQFFS